LKNDLGTSKGYGMRVKRVTVATCWGLVFGVVCWLGGKYLLGKEVGTALAVLLILLRTLMGFIIGISALKRMNFLLHGAFIGAIASLPSAIYFLLLPDYRPLIGVAHIFAGALYGLLIELLTVKVFKAPIV